jgi:putative spermidine/putrescine transport system substrate-binding protein
MTTRDRFGNLNRRSTLKVMAGSAGAFALPFVDRRDSVAHAESSNTIRYMAGPTANIDWTDFERETGLKMEFTPFHTDDVGALYNEILVNQVGDRIDLVSCLAGAQKNLIKQGALAEIDVNKLPNYSGIMATIRESPLLYSGNGKHWSLPLYYNADSFGYFPEKLGLPRPPEPLTWDVVLNDKKTLGLTALEGDLIGLMIGGMYVKSRGIADIADPANMTKSECKAATDWLIERKKAGQFRSFWTDYDQQVANFMNGEVVAQQCWEPAVRQVREAKLDVEYAYCSDFYFLWMHSLFPLAQVAKRGNMDNIHKALNWFLGGSYAAQLAILRGYNSCRMDLGLDYARNQGWSGDKIAALERNILKVKTKFLNSNYWVGGAPDDLEVYESELARFRNA